MISITFYGFVYAAAFTFLFFILYSYLQKHKKDTKLAYPWVIYEILGVVVGARVFYVVFYNILPFLKNPVMILYIWNGGLSSHGGILGFIIVLFIFCKINNIDTLDIGDKIAIYTAFFLVLGRIANFFNQEISGTSSGGFIHPVSIYLAIKNLLIFILLVILNQYKNLKKGTIFFLSIFLYSFLRFLIEFVRYYQIEYLGLGIGQYLNIITFLISGFFLIKLYMKK